MPRLIDANAALYAALTGADKWDNGSNYERDVKIEEEMNKVPTIEAEPVRHGRWIKTYTCHGERAWGFECNQSAVQRWIWRVNDENRKGA